MSKLLQSALSEDESEKATQVEEDSDSLLGESDEPAESEPAEESDDLLAEPVEPVELPSDGMPEPGDELDLDYDSGYGHAAGGMCGPNDVLSLVQGTLEADGLDTLAGDADGAPGGGFKQGGEPASPDDEYSVLRSMRAPASK